MKRFSVLFFAALFTLSASTLGSVAYANGNPEDSEYQETQWVEIDDETYQKIRAEGWGAIEEYTLPDGSLDYDKITDTFPTKYNMSMKKKSSGERSLFFGARREPNPHGCQLYPVGSSGVGSGSMYMHTRTGSGSSKYGIIGWKPITKCQSAPVEISYDNIFFRHIFIFGWFPEASGAPGKVTLQTSFEQKNIEFHCRSKKTTKWKGRTQATLEATNGKKYIAQQYTQEYKTNCGA